MLRNREIQRLILVLFVTAIALIAAAVSVSWEAAVIAAMTSILLIGTALIFTAWRYREIAKLTRSLRRIAAGDYSLDVRDNHEGELSILKNEIYKVTLMLSEHSALLQKDKLRLTDAISDISHQLKTPLTSMKVMADLLSDAKLPEAKRSEFTRNLRMQLERIEWLISSLLKLSKIDAGTAHFKRERVTVKALVEKSLEPLLIPMDIKGQTVTVEGPEDTAFLGDANWTAEALINILKNAVEHTPEGGAIAIRFHENALFTEIVIQDNGRGIPKEDLPYIFKRFYKGKHAGEGSVGIGLALAHTIVTSQNGTIDVRSAIGNGTKFTIKFYKQIV